MSKFTIVNADDWAALYKDGVLVTQGHEITVDELATAAGIELDEKWADQYLDGYAHSRFPGHLDEITFDI